MRAPRLARFPVLLLVGRAIVRSALRRSLVAERFVVLEADDIAGAIAEALRKQPGLVLIDLAGDHARAESITRALRCWSGAWITLIADEATESSKVAALDAGADDFLAHPFGVAELLARVRAAVRKLPPRETAARVAAEDVRVDPKAGGVSIGGEAVHLTPIEQKLLAFLARHAGYVLTYSQILGHVWGERRDIAYLRVYMNRLRTKLERTPDRPTRLLTVPGVGYGLDIKVGGSR